MHKIYHISTSGRKSDFPLEEEILALFHEGHFLQILSFFALNLGVLGDTLNLLILTPKRHVLV